MCTCRRALISACVRVRVHVMPVRTCMLRFLQVSLKLTSVRPLTFHKRAFVSKEVLKRL